MRSRCKYIEVVSAMFNHVLIKIFKKIKMENQQDKCMKLTCGEATMASIHAVWISPERSSELERSSAGCRDVKVTRVIIASC